MSRKNFNNLNLEDVLTDKAVEEDFLEVPLTDRIFRFLSLSTAGIVILVAAQLLNIGAAQNLFYKNRALANISYRKIIPVPRGIVMDRFGLPLVANEPSSNAYLAPRFLPVSSAERFEIFKRVSGILGIDEKIMEKKVTARDWSLTDRILLASDLSHDQLIAFSLETIPGVEIESDFKRTSSEPLKFSHVLGYTGFVTDEDLKSNPSLVLDDEIGKSGLEAYYDGYLRGVNGEELLFRDAFGELEEQSRFENPKPGYRLETFIDRDFQAYFYDRLKETLDNLGRNSGVGIAFNPQNGEVLSLVSVPGFDSAQIEKSLNDPAKPLFNRAVSGLYNPGSIIKPLVATAVLTEGVIDPSKKIFSAGFIDVPNPYNPQKPSRFLDWKAHGWVDLYSALAVSSDVYFYEVSGGFKDQTGLGILKLKKWWQKFNLDKKTDIDLIGEKTGFLPDPEWKEKIGRGIWRLGDTYNVSIGQGDLSATPLELLNYISALANGGKFYKPRIMREIKDENGATVLKNEEVVLNDIGAEIKNSLPDVRKGMEDAVTKFYGTANLLSSLPVSSAAKTGSAQIENNTKINAFVAAYAPAENPQVAILVLVENAREGSLNAVPVAKDVLYWYYQNRIKFQKR